jgi:16S rRNA (guanine966-N2)-methyltransferase
LPGKVRIIGGKWRGRKLPVVDTPQLRPTPDRVKETLFNWLSPYITGADCLDLFAGTGSLGFEALSRGASHVVMVEHDRGLANQLQKQGNLLVADELEIICADVPGWLKRCNQSFDIVFIDPPYSSVQAGNITQQLLNCDCLKTGALIYLESDRKGIDFAPQLQLMKNGKAGLVQFQLLKYTQDT